jgi:hypothetical protein
MKLRGLFPNSYIHVSVSDLYISTIGLTILLQENSWGGPIVGIYIYIAHRYVNVETRTEAAQFLFGENIN